MSHPDARQPSLPPRTAFEAAKPGPASASPLAAQAASFLTATPRRLRLTACCATALLAAIAANVLLQRTKSAAKTGDAAFVTGIRAPGSAEAVAQAPVQPIKTAGLPQAAPAAIDQQIKRWQARLRQLETEAQGDAGPHLIVPGAGANVAAGQGSLADRPTAVLQTPETTPNDDRAGAVNARALEPTIAHRLDGDAVAPLAQQTVRALQRELTERGYDPGPADGNIGLLTQAAIMAFEHDAGLPLTGEPSEALLRRVVLGGSADDAGSPAAPSGEGKTAGRLIKGVQRALASLKYAPGRTDGVVSDETRRAIREFEMDQGLVPSGRISGRLILRLARASGRAFVVPAD